LNEVQHFRLYFVPVIRVRTQVFQETALPPHSLEQTDNPFLKTFLIGSLVEVFVCIFDQVLKDLTDSMGTLTARRILPLFSL
jgi:hypothetical protein